MSKKPDYIGGTWILIKLSGLLFFLVILLNGFRLTFSDLPDCEQAYKAQTTDALLLLNPVWIGLTCLFATVGLTFGVLHYFKRLKIAELEALVLVLERTNIQKGNFYRLSIHADTAIIDLELYKPNGKMLVRLEDLRDDDLYDWLMNKKGNDILSKTYSARQLAEITAMTLTLEKDYLFKKSHLQLLNVKKAIELREKREKKEVADVPFHSVPSGMTYDMEVNTTDLK